MNELLRNHFSGRSSVINKLINFRRDITSTYIQCSQKVSCETRSPGELTKKRNATRENQWALKSSDSGQRNSQVWWVSRAIASPEQGHRSKLTSRAVEESDCPTRLSKLRELRDMQCSFQALVLPQALFQVHITGNSVKTASKETQFKSIEETFSMARCSSLKILALASLRRRNSCKDEDSG